MNRLLPTAMIASVLVCAACGSEPAANAGAATGAICPEHSSLDYDGFVKPFMAKYCTRCHASDVPASERAGAPLDHNFDTLDGILEELDHVEQDAAAGPDGVNTKMPPSGPKPTLDDRKKLGEWIACQGHGAADDHAH